MKYSLIRWCALTYARGKLGIGCIRFKHAGIRWYTLTYARGKLGIGVTHFKHAGIHWYTLGPKYSFQHVEKCWAYVPVWIRYLYVQYGINTVCIILYFRGLFVRIKNILWIFIRNSYVSLILRNSDPS